MTERRCPKCREIKPIEEFYEYPDTGGRRSLRCTPCAQQLRAEKYQQRKRGLAGREPIGSPTVAVGVAVPAEGDFKSVYERLKARRDALRPRRRRLSDE